ncbi:Protein kinase domain-containing protein [Aphelenchoides fujianensis]|nr:Protein kinase domain-containing protein [Aphelenchoides fujianensis]
MPPKRVAAAKPAGRGPKKAKLCVELPARTEIAGRPTIVIGKEIGKGGFARVYSGEVKDTKVACAVKFEPSDNGCLFVEQKLFQSIFTEKALDTYKAKKKLKWLGLPHCVRFGLFTYAEQELRFIAMPLYHSSLQAYIDGRPGKVLTLAEVQNTCIPRTLCTRTLKAENLMFPLTAKSDLQKLTLIDFGMAGRNADTAVEQPKAKSAHNGTAYFTSTDAHRGCAPTFRGDYEILGHNLLCWFAGLEKLPWKNLVKDL